MAEPIRFPDVPVYQGWGAPVRLESELRDLEMVAGSVPEDLNGTLYRCGPDPQYPPMQGDSVFIDGEGMASMFRFDHGHVDFRTRYVRNERFTLQEKARRSLFGRYRNRYTNDPSVAGKNRGHRQHQRDLARRQIADPQGGLAAVGGRSRHARDHPRVGLWRRGEGRQHDGASEARSRHRRAADLLLPGQGRRHDRRRVLHHRPARQDRARNVVQRAVGADGPRFRA